MQNKIITSKKIAVSSAILVSVSTLSMAVSTALYAAQPVGVQVTDSAIKSVTTSNLPKRYIIKYKQNQNTSVVMDDNNAAYTSNVTENTVNHALAVQNTLKKLGVKVRAQYPEINIISAQLSAKDIVALNNDSNVEYVEEDLPRHLMAQSTPYGISMVQADQVDDSVASANAGGKKICIIDSGLNLPHEDLGAKFGTINGTNDSGTGNWFDQGGPHGTHVGGTIAALNNGIGVRGVIGSDPSIHIVKVFNSSGWGYSSDLVSAINTCKDNGADVINMSLGGTGSSVTEKNGIQAAYDAGILLIAAAGNDGVATNATDAESFPASYDAVMSVAAVDKNKALADFSQKNTQVEISGPGVDVYSTYPEGLGSVVEVSVAGASYAANAMENKGTVNGVLYNLGTGEAIDNSAAGKVCLIQRGNVSFNIKVKNCEDSGGIGVIIYNNAAGSFGGTLGTTNTTTIPGVTVSDTDGATMLANIGSSASINIGAGNYGKMSGTSMASPHVTGVAALVWSTHPSCTNVQIRNVLTLTAQDLGATGRDVKFGYGLAQTKDAIDYITANGCDGNGNGGGTGGGNGGGTGATVLVNGVATTGLTATAGNDVVYTIDVPAGATNISFNMTGGTGDGDMYVKFGAIPTDTAYDCRPYNTGNVEACTGTSTGGTYYVRVKAYSTFSGVSLTASYTPASTGGGTTIQPVSETVSNITVAKSSWKRYTYALSAGYGDLTVAISGGTGDADLYVTKGAQSTTSVYDCRSWATGNTESCIMTNPAQATWYIDVYGYSAASGITLTLSATPK